MVRHGDATLSKQVQLGEVHMRLYGIEDFKRIVPMRIKTDGLITPLINRASRILVPA
jgi:hypothetical protein